MLKVNLCVHQGARWCLQPSWNVRELIDKITTHMEPHLFSMGAIPADKDFQSRDKKKTTLHEPEIILISSPLFLMPVSEQRWLHTLSFILAINGGFSLIRWLPISCMYTEQQKTCLKERFFSTANKTNWKQYENSALVNYMTFISQEFDPTKQTGVYSMSKTVEL